MHIGKNCRNSKPRRFPIHYFLCCLLLIFLANSVQAQKSAEKRYLLDKGTFHNGFTFKFNIDKVENEDRLIVLVEDRKTNSFDFNLDAGYFIKKNWALGGLVQYGSSRRIGVDINSQNERSEVNKAQKSWGIFGTTKLYIPLEEGNRFFLFSNILIGGTMDRTLTESLTNSVLKRTFVENYSAELKFSPGIMINVIEGFSVETGAEIGGIRSKWSNTIINGVPYTKKQSVSTDLSINLLRLSLGFYYFFDLNKNK